MADIYLGGIASISAIRAGPLVESVDAFVRHVGAVVTLFTTVE